MLNKLILGCFLMLSIGCSDFEYKKCLSNINSKNSILFKEMNLNEKIIGFDLREYCNSDRYDFINDVNTYANKLKGDENKFYTYLIYAYLYRDQHQLSMFLDFLFNNNVNIEKNFFEILNNTKLMSKLNYSDEEINSLKIVGSSLKNMNKGYKLKYNRS